VTAPEITFALLDGAQAAVNTDEYTALHADAADYPARFRVQRRQPGFVLAEARHGGYLIGYASGMPLRPSTDWWRHLTTALPADFTTEHPGRTFALLDLVVRASWRRQRIGETLHDMIVDGRTEERATVKIASSAVPAQNALQQWGWRKAGKTRDPGLPVADILVRQVAPLPCFRVRGVITGSGFLVYPGEVSRRTRDDRQRDDLRLVVAVPFREEGGQFLIPVGGQLEQYEPLLRPLEPVVPPVRGRHRSSDLRARGQPGLYRGARELHRLGPRIGCRLYLEVALTCHGLIVRSGPRVR
jgi:GNAT superfamily N-acetyltransferase